MTTTTIADIGITISALTDTFDGDNAALIASAVALLQIDASGSASHPVPGAAKTLLSSLASRLKALAEQELGSHVEESDTWDRSQSDKPGCHSHSTEIERQLTLSSQDDTLTRVRDWLDTYDREASDDLEEGEIAKVDALAEFARDDIRHLLDLIDAHGSPPYQSRVGTWMMNCFGADITNSLDERSFRFFEEAGELCQALGMGREMAHKLVNYTWNRLEGDMQQEVGGVMVTLAALCHAAGLDMDREGETELARINTPEIMDKIRRKHAAKVLRTPHSALPGQGSDQ